VRGEEESSRRTEADGGGTAARALTHAPQDVMGGRIGSASLCLLLHGRFCYRTVSEGGSTEPGRERTSGAHV
jgi:hypothetical protein